MFHIFNYCNILRLFIATAAFIKAKSFDKNAFRVTLYITRPHIHIDHKKSTALRYVNMYIPNEHLN